MQKILIEKELFEYNELSEAAKEAAKNDYLLEECRGFACQEAIDEKFAAKCAKLFESEHIDLRLQYDFSCCQGSGVNIYGVISFADVVKAAKKTMNLLGMQLHRLEFYTEFLTNIELTENYRYTYSLKDTDKKDFDLDYYIDDIFIAERANITEQIRLLLIEDKQLIKDVVDSMFEQLTKIEGELYKYGCKIFNEVTDEDMEAREAYYTADGKFYNYIYEIN